ASRSTKRRSCASATPSSRRPSTNAGGRRSPHRSPAARRRQDMAETGFLHPEFLVDTENLARRLGDPALRVFDCTTHLVPDPRTTYQVVAARADFETGHIPGAQFIDLQADLSAEGTRLRFMRPTAAAFAAAMRRFGVGDGSKIVLYSTTTPQWATRVWWLL